MKRNRLTSEQNVLKRIRELREELVSLIDYLDLLEARSRNVRNEYAHQLEPDVREKFDELFRIDDKINAKNGNVNSAGDAERLNKASQHCMEFILSLDSV